MVKINVKIFYGFIALVFVVTYILLSILLSIAYRAYQKASSAYINPLSRCAEPGYISNLAVLFLNYENILTGCRDGSGRIGTEAEIRNTAVLSEMAEKNLESWAVRNGKIDLIERVGVKYRKEIGRSARLNGIDPRLIAAMIAVEWDERNLVSIRGARGEMGLMPATARAMGVKNINNSADNIEGGVKYLKLQLEKFSDLDQALAAYNAGPGNVMKYDGIPPFRETRNYVERVKFLAYYR
ncbi:MAG: lytic transglycosylase domain-containing protein [Candidatus Falkowbacteria bacterium]